jgi:23S rRNA pseudouridine2605 synthase
MIRSGHVAVNGRLVRDPAVWVDPKSDSISINGKTAHPAPRVYILLHKPTGVVTTRSDELARQTVYEYLPRGTPWVFPAGRLDRESSGLILLTNDTKSADRLTNPVEQCIKRYKVILDRPLSSKDQATMETGMILLDGTVLKPAKVTHVGGAAYTFCLVEGRNRQIRRMCHELGYEVLVLHRTEIGPLKIRGLAPGTARALSRREIMQLFSANQKEE